MNPIIELTPSMLANLADICQCWAEETKTPTGFGDLLGLNILHDNRLPTVDRRISPSAPIFRRSTVS